MIYPWHQKQWLQLSKAYDRGQLAHAYLLSGDAMMGQRQFAWHYAQWLLCSNPSDKNPCGKCSECELFIATTHPDFYTLLASNSESIKIDQIRELQQRLYKTPQRAGFQIIVIDPASKLNHYAMAALLKTLEEPVGEVVIFLIEPCLQLLPQTIVSRAQMIYFENIDNISAVNWLREHHSMPENKINQLLDIALGSPLRALYFKENNVLSLLKQMINDLLKMLIDEVSPLDIAKKWEKQDYQLVIWLLYIIILNLMLTSQGVQQLHLSSSDFHDVIDSISKKIDSQVLAIFSKEIDYLYLNKDNLAVHKVYLFESICLRWRQLV